MGPSILLLQTHYLLFHSTFLEATQLSRNRQSYLTGVYVNYSCFQNDSRPRKKFVQVGYVADAGQWEDPEAPRGLAKYFGSQRS